MQLKELNPLPKDNKMHQSNIVEGLEQHDLKRLIHDELHIDEFKSKMGRDEDVVVISFKVTGREPAEDLVNFVEKGYEWVIDADVSSGEMDDGDYIVFVEGDRTQDMPELVVDLMKDVMNLTDQKLSDWRLMFRSSPEEFEITADNIRANVPLTAQDYLRRFGTKELDEMRTAAGVAVTTKAPKNDYTQSLRSLAGIL
jgi:hypothetical protein